MLRKRRPIIESQIPEKANRILNVILVVLLLIGFRIWHLAVIQHDVKLEESKKPQRKTIIEKSDRATIRDRFNIPLAINKIQYSAAVIYGQLRQIPRYEWGKDEQGKKIKVPRRKEYIEQLAKLLARELSLDPERLEDLIYSKASVLGNIPFTIKEGLTEREYFRLKGLEKDWLGIHAEKTARRFYPLGPVGGDIIGYMGAISKSEYDSITTEMHALRNEIRLWEEGENAEVQSRQAIDAAEKRLQELEARAYTINDSIGKAGIEGFFDEKLRGFRGKKTFVSDIRGNFLRELSSSKRAQPGERFLLTISSELQAYAERLLVEYEEIPIERIGDFNRLGIIPPKQPWIKGGAIVVMDPNNGEILTLASFPRFDPNDFIKDSARQDDEKKKWRIHRWLEDEAYIAAIWDGKIPLERERFSVKEGSFYEEEIELGWQTYLDFILPNESGVKKNILSIKNLGLVLDIQEKVERLIGFFIEHNPSISASKIFDFIYEEPHVQTGSICSIREKELLRKGYFLHEEEIREIQGELAPYFANIFQNYEKILLIDLCRIIADPSRFTLQLRKLVAEQPLEDFRKACARMSIIEDGVKRIVENVFHEALFSKWRQDCFKQYLCEKRKEEENQKRPPKPYVDYLDQVEKEFFVGFWEKYKWDLITFFLTGEKFVSEELEGSEFLSPEEPKSEIFRFMGSDLEEEFASFYHHLSLFSQEIKLGAHSALPLSEANRNLLEVLSEYTPSLIRHYLPALRDFKELNRPLLGWYSGLRKQKGQQLEKHLAAAFYPTCGYGYARSQAYRQATTIGSVFKLITAYEAFSQRYRQLKSEDKSLQELNFLTIIDDKHRSSNNLNGWNVGYTVDRKPIPMFYHGGRLPRSDHAGVGKVDFFRALEASSNPYFAILAGDFFKDPEDLCKAAGFFSYGERTGIEIPGEIPGSLPKDISYNRTGLYALSIGQHSLVGTPLQTAVMMSAFANGGEVLKPQIVRMTLDGTNAECIKELEKEVRREVFLPKEIQQMLIEGMHQVVIGDRGTARFVRHFGLQFDEDMPELYNEICHQIVGKTSTAESLERLSLDGSYGKLMCKHVGFACISFDQKLLSKIDFQKPELVVIVYLRFGDYGKQAAPIAVHMIKKWREIKSRHGKPG